MSTRRSHFCKSILVVEDDQDIRNTVATVLRTEGYDVHTAPNGRAAAEALNQIPQPCLILLDLMMPEMDGWEFLDTQRARVISDGLPVVIVSALGAPTALGHEDAAVPAVGYMSKPIGINTLLDLIERYCEPPSSSAHSELEQARA